MDRPYPELSCSCSRSCSSCSFNRRSSSFSLSLSRSCNLLATSASTAFDIYAINVSVTEGRKIRNLLSHQFPSLLIPPRHYLTDLHRTPGSSPFRTLLSGHHQITQMAGIHTPQKPETILGLGPKSIVTVLTLGLQPSQLQIQYPPRRSIAQSLGLA